MQILPSLQYIRRGCHIQNCGHAKQGGVNKRVIVCRAWYNKKIDMSIHYLMRRFVFKFFFSKPTNVRGLSLQPP